MRLTEGGRRRLDLRGTARDRGRAGVFLAFSWLSLAGSSCCPSISPGSCLPLPSSSLASVSDRRPCPSSGLGTVDPAPVGWSRSGWSASGLAGWCWCSGPVAFVRP